MNKKNIPAPEQKEETRHGEPYFPVQRYITKIEEEYPAVTTHWHEEAELTVILKGRCRYQIDLVEYEAEEGDILFVPPLVLHAIRKKAEEEMISETYVFHLNFLGGNSTDICAARYLTPIIRQEIRLPHKITKEHPVYVSLKRVFDQIRSVYDSNITGYEIAIKSFLLQAIFLLLQYSEKFTKQEMGEYSEKLKSVLDYIETHIEETISIEELSKVCYFSEYHFMRFFKKHMNMTCIEYINNLRLEKAVEAFEAGNTSILEVSLSVGFHNLSYFHRAFKKKYGMTPRTFINTLEKNKDR